MFAPDDTIAAIATPAGRGGIGVVRISGGAATGVAAEVLGRARPLEPWKATFGCVRVTGSAQAEGSANGHRRVDQVVATFFPAPRSYTGEDVVELSVHGSPVVLRTVLEAVVSAGARLAEPGEFTFRAFLNGRLDLVQAEAVADLIDAVTPAQARAAFDQLDGTLTERLKEIADGLFDLSARLEASLDFPDEGYHFIRPENVAEELKGTLGKVGGLLKGARSGRLLREGATVVIVGKPNVGKSTLFNRLLGGERAIVDECAGTTRDLLTERTEFLGVPVTLVDGAGIRAAAESIEAEGVARARRAAGSGDLAIVVLDRSGVVDEDDERALEATAGTKRVVVANKADKVRSGLNAINRVYDLEISAVTGLNLDRLREVVVGALTGEEPLRDEVAVTNLRHVRLLEEVQSALLRAVDGAASEVPEEFVLADVTAARERLEEITGRRTSDDVLKHIFSRFCIGK